METALQYSSAEPNFVLVEQPLVKDKNIRQLGEYLKREGMEEEYHSYQSLMQDTDQLGALLGQLQQMSQTLEEERAMHKQTTQQLEEASGRMSSLEQTLAGMQKNMDRYEDSTNLRFGERLNALKNGYVNLKAGIKEHVNDLLLDFKVNGKAALARVSELADVKGKMAWMLSCVKNGIYEYNKSIDRQNHMHAEYTKATAALIKAENLQNEGKSSYRESPIRLILQRKEEMIVKRLQRMEYRKDCLQKIVDHLAAGISRVEDFERSAAQAKDVRLSEQLQAAEQNAAREEMREVFEQER